MALKRLRRFAVCIRNEGYEASLERNKIYLVQPDPEAETDGDIRIVDESGEDYLYPANCIFEPLRLDAALFNAVRVDEELGTIVWPNGADIDPDVLIHGRTPESLDGGSRGSAR